MCLCFLNVFLSNVWIHSIAGRCKDVPDSLSFNEIMSHSSCSLYTILRIGLSKNMYEATGQWWDGNKTTFPVHWWRNSIIWKISVASLYFFSIALEYLWLATCFFLWKHRYRGIDSSDTNVKTAELKKRNSIDDSWLYVRKVFNQWDFKTIKTNYSNRSIIIKYYNY